MQPPPPPMVMFTVLVFIVAQMVSPNPVPPQYGSK
jgi:hypothetical protein